MVPDLGEIRALARGHEFARAQALLGQYLRLSPSDDYAHLLMAQVAMDRPDPQPSVALNHLAKIQSSSGRDRAVVRFSMGKAYYQQKRYDLAESWWKEALGLDPLVPEAGWALLDLLDLEGRVEEAHQLGMRLYQTEPDPRDRIRLLLEMARLDIDKVAPGSQVQVFESLWREHPENLALSLVVGLALVHNSQPEEGLKVLHATLDDHPGSCEAWDGWLTGLDDAHELDLLREEFGRLPTVLRSDPRFAKHRGNVMQGARNWPMAVAAYRCAYTYEPFNGTVLYRLRMSLRVLGKPDELDQIDRLLTTYQNAFKQMRAVYLEALSTSTIGLAPHTELYRRLADLREQVGRFDESRAWNCLILHDVPGDARSLAAVARLK
jgi:tetratricopeptide (TPR) repeat protein